MPSFIPFIVALHKRNASTFAARMGWGPMAYHVVENADQLRGIGAGHTVLMLANWREREDWTDIEQVLVTADANGAELMHVTKYWR